MPRRPGSLQEHISVHPDRQGGRIEPTEVSRANKQIVVKAIIATRVVMEPGDGSGMRVVEWRHPFVERRHINPPGEQVMRVSAALRLDAKRGRRQKDVVVKKKRTVIHFKEDVLGDIV